MATKSASLPRIGTLRSLGAAWRRFLLWLLVLGSLSSVPLLLQTSHVTTTNYHLQPLQQEREQWLALNAALEAQIAEAGSLRRIESIARDELGMIEASEHLFVNASAASVVTPTQATEKTTVREKAAADTSTWKAVFKALAFWQG